MFGLQRDRTGQSTGPEGEKVGPAEECQGLRGQLEGERSQRLQDVRKERVERLEAERKLKRLQKEYLELENRRHGIRLQLEAERKRGARRGAWKRFFTGDRDPGKSS